MNKALGQELTAEQAAALDEAVAARAVHDNAKSAVSSAEWRVNLANVNEREVATAELDAATRDLRVKLGERNRAVRAAADAGCETKTLVDALNYAPGMLDRIVAGRVNSK
jgi:hypothetical protein